MESDRRFARELFARYPGTMSLPWVGLATLPTPVESMPALASAAGAAGLWVKRDDLSGAAYGGNKVRKLEFLLGEALAAGATDVITFGAAGSNHALATAIYAGRLGFKVHSMLLPQPNARYVGRNVLAGIASGADLRHYPDRAHLLRATARLKRELRDRTGRQPCVIPFGGTTARSSAGFVSAGLELATQIEKREMPEPDVVYVALGSMGTAAGVALGMRAAGLRSKVVAVPVVSYEVNTSEALLALIRETQDLLHASDSTFPRFAWGEGDVEVASGFLGEGYAHFTPEGMEAVRAADASGLHLEGTYTGKTFSAILAHGRSGRLEAATVLFWNTYSSADISVLTRSAGTARVPARLRPYLERDVQPLDREPS
ncbi:MAG: pyridoxal-phosphate dependent enzyme [Coriobacteriia bacterium]|nr:pyridoxal-phosphate dependent enzyme [Coriobacteriia bacterium]